MMSTSAQLWLKSYPSYIPASINPDAYHSINDLFEQTVAKFQKLPAFTSFNKTISYHDLDTLSQQFAAYLQNELKLEKGSRIALMLPNILQYPIALFGALRAGMVVVNVNPLYTPRELEHQLADSGASVIVILANFAHTLAQVSSKTAIKHIIITEIGDCLGLLKGFLFNFVVRYIKKAVPPYHLPVLTSFKKALAIGKKQPYTPPAITGDDLAFLQYTGGTTGIAKGAMLTHRNLIANLEQVSAWVQYDLEVGKEIVVTPLPLYHIFALTANCLTFMKIGGHNLLIANPRDIAGFIKELKQFRFTILTGVNTLFNALMNHPDCKTIDFSSLKIALGGGMALQQAVSERWQQLTGKALSEGYGLTECSPVVAVNPLHLTHYTGSIGLPLPSTEVALLDSEGQTVAIGQAGELCVKGPQVMKGYWQRPQETLALFNAEGWLCTGDIAVMDDNGFIRIVDRKKDMILVSGFNVYPNEIEAVVALLDSVLESAAIGVPDEKTGEAIKLFVVRKDPRESKDAIIKHCRQYLTAYKVPKIIEFRESLPKTNVGKILRRELR